MSDLINNVKTQLRPFLSQVYKEAKRANLPKKEFDSFLKWYWEIRRLIEFDVEEEKDQTGDTSEKGLSKLVVREATDTEKN